MVLRAAVRDQRGLAGGGRRTGRSATSPFAPTSSSTCSSSPRRRARGLGLQLLEKAKEAYAELSLWTFQQNLRARRFYERHGFVAVTETDGADNEEKLPDVLYRWRREQTVIRGRQL